MGLNYDGDATPPGGQDSPSVDPAFGAVPTITLPTSGEGGVARFYQPLKTLADWVAFFGANGVAINGSLSLKKLLIDAALASPASVPDGVLQVDGDATGHTYEELVKFPLQGSSMFRRTFRSSAGIHHTTNAKWVVITGVGHWRADDGTHGGTFISESATGINSEMFTGAAPGSSDYVWTSRLKLDGGAGKTQVLSGAFEAQGGATVSGGPLVSAGAFSVQSGGAAFVGGIGVDSKFSVDTNGQITKYNNAIPEGIGVAYVGKVGYQVAWTGASTTVLAYAPPASGLYRVQTYVSCPTNGDTVTLTVTWKDTASSTTITKTLMGAIAISVNDVYVPAALLVDAKTGTNVTVAITVASQVTTVGSATVERLS